MLYKNRIPVTLNNRQVLYTFIVLIVISAGLIFSNLITPIKIFKNILAKVVFPVSYAVEYPIKKTGDSYDRVKLFLNVYRENEKLKEAIDKLKSGYRDFEYISAETEKLMGLLEFKLHPAGLILPVRVLIHSPEHYFSKININKGRHHGVTKDSALINIVGSNRVIAGRVDEVFEDFSSVVLITSPDFRCAGELPDGSRGIIRGNDSWVLKFDYLSPDAGVSIGDKIYTSGTGGIFPGGLLVGMVKSVDILEFSKGKSAEVVPYKYPQDSKYFHVLVKQ